MTGDEAVRTVARSIRRACRALSMRLDRRYGELRKRAVEFDDSLARVTELVDEHLLDAPKERRYDFYEAYARDELRQITYRWDAGEPSSPILVCVVRDELAKIKVQMSCMRSLGIRHFAYVDNASTDGTFEWLAEQHDVNLFEVGSEFRPDKKTAWIRRVTDRYGYGRWYLMCDADEILSYPECEHVDIGNYIAFLESRGKTSVCAMMLDMYPSSFGWDVSPDADSLLETYRYFDVGGYQLGQARYGARITGGPRQRAIFDGDGLTNLQTKYPLVKLGYDDMYFSHSVASRCREPDRRLHAVLRHYKFLPSDIRKYREYARTGVHSGGSAEYKAYARHMRPRSGISFYDDTSVEWKSSKSMLSINIFDREFYEGDEPTVVANSAWGVEEGLPPLITVTTPVYNRRTTLPRTIASVEAQTLRNIEYIIIDDGSTEDADDIVAEYMGRTDLPVLYVKKPNGGVHTARNMAYQLARGKLVLCIDSDDELLPTACETFWNAWMSIPEASRGQYWQMKAQCVDADGNITGTLFPEGINRMPQEEAWRHFSASRGEQIGCRVAEVMRKNLFPEPEGVTFVSEDLMWIPLERRYQSWGMNDVVRVYHREGGGHLSGRSDLTNPQDLRNGLWNAWYRLENDERYAMGPATYAKTILLHRVFFRLVRRADAEFALAHRLGKSKAVLVSALLSPLTILVTIAYKVLRG